MTTRDRAREKPRDIVAEVNENYEPDDAIKQLLSAHGHSWAPPMKQTGSHQVAWSGKKFNLPAEPEPLGLRESADILNRKADEEDQEISVSEVIDALPWDGAQAFIRAVDDMFGWGILQKEKRQTFFGTIKVPPTMRTIRTGPNPTDTIQVFWGEIFIPQIDAQLQTSATRLGNKMVFAISGSIQKKNAHKVKLLIELARIYAYERSIYKGKAFRMFVDEKGVIDANREPDFIKLDRKLEEDLVFSDIVRQQIETNLFTPIRYPKECRGLGIPLKRGVLLEGPYGVGKSMTAAVTASLAIANGWTFIMLDRVAGLKAVLEFAHRYAPVVVFAEDIDRVIAGDDRTVKIDDVLNTLDGVQGKHHEIITVLTTNHADKINRALLRPGRLDAIVTITPPDAKAAERLMRLYGRGLIKDTTSLTEAGESIAGHIPAVIREVVERAKLTAVWRTAGIPTELVDQDLVVAAATMKSHLDLMAGQKPPEYDARQRLGNALVEVLQELATDQVAEHSKTTISALTKIAGEMGIDLNATE